MVFCAVVIFYILFSSFVQCSSIITKSMIRMPNGSFHGFSRPTNPGSQLPKPEMLTSRPSDSELEDGHPFKLEEEVNTSDNHAVLDNDLPFETPVVEHFIQLNSSKIISNPTTTISEKRDPDITDVKHTNVFENELENLKERRVNTNTTFSPKELSSKYWAHYNNFSNEFFNKWIAPDKNKEDTESKIHKRYPERSILEILQHVFSCFWTSELFSCVQDGFGGAHFENFSFFHLMSPRLPRFQVEDDSEDGFTNRNDDLEYGLVEEGEGRKKLYKRLLQVIPFLLMLKMTMLPALAVMALVSGKAFLMSLLSLGVALVATFSSAVPFRADKRHEIESHQTAATAHPSEQLPGKYYYVM